MKSSKNNISHLDSTKKFKNKKNISLPPILLDCDQNGSDSYHNSEKYYFKINSGKISFRNLKHTNPHKNIDKENNHMFLNNNDLNYHHHRNSMLKVKMFEENLKNVESFSIQKDIFNPLSLQDNMI